MTDVLTLEQRHKNMAAIKSKNTKPEVLVRKMLHKEGFRFRLHNKQLPGKPDIILPKYKAVIFTHGCFWHGHNCSVGKLPKSKLDYWVPKITRNLRRDKKNIENLQNLGWRVCVIRECFLRGKNKATNIELINELKKWISSEQDALLLSN